MELKFYEPSSTQEFVASVGAALVVFLVSFLLSYWLATRRHRDWHWLPAIAIVLTLLLGSGATQMALASYLVNLGKPSDYYAASLEPIFLSSLLVLAGPLIGLAVGLRRTKLSSAT